MKVVILVVLLACVGHLGSAEPKQERDALGDVLEQFSGQLRDFLKSIGISEDKQQELVDEFIQIVKNIPIPPLNPIDYLRPSKVIAYVKEVTAFIQDAYDRIIKQAKDLLNIKDVSERAISFNLKLPGGKILVAADFSSIGKYLKEQFEALGLGIEDQERLLNRYEEYVKGLPKLRPLDLLNPAKILQFVEYVTVRLAEFVGNVLHEAEELVKDILVKDRTRSIQERDALGDVLEQFSNQLRDFLKSIGISEDKQQELVDEFIQIVKNIPIPPLNPIDYLRPSKVIAYVKEVTAFIQDAYDRIIKQAKDLLNIKDVSERAISFNLKLPGGKILVAADFSSIGKYLKEQFEALGLGIEDQERLLDRYEEYVKGLPKLRPLDLLNPAKILQFVEYVTVRLAEFVGNILHEAEELVKDILIKDRTRAVRLPGLADLVDHLRERVEKVLDSLTGLKSDQRKELVREFLNKMKEFPHIKGWETLKPSQIGQYIKEIKEFADDVIKTIVNKAKEMIKNNQAERKKRGIENIGQRLPGLRDLVEYLQKCFEQGLAAVSGLTEEQHEELVDGFLATIRNYANLKGIETVKPSQVKQYVEDIKKYADEVTKAFVEKAKIMVGHSQQKRAIEMPQFIKDLHEKLVNAFKTAIYTFTGLTHDQQTELVNEFKKGLSETPLPSFSINPLNWVKYIADLTRHNIELTKRLIQKARDLLKENRPTRSLNWEALREEFILQFKNVLGSVSGLTTEETEALIQEFKDHIDTFPKFELSDIFSPSKVIQYIKELRQFNLKLVRLFLEKAKAIVDYRLGKTDRNRRFIDFKITFPDVTDDEDIPDFRRLLEYVREQVAGLGLTEQETNYLLHRLERELQKYPRRPTGLGALNPLRWAQYLAERNAYVKNTVLKALRDAEDYARNKKASLKN